MGRPLALAAVIVVLVPAIGSIPFTSGETKPPAKWVPAASSNYTPANREADGNDIKYIIVHVTEGSYNGTISWFRNPNAGASAHYVIRNSDGDITQMVADDDIAWHAGNWEYNRQSVGIEHEGYTGSTLFTEALYRSSAWLVRNLTEAYSIPRDRQHIIGHNEVPDPNNPGQYGGVNHHTDPGATWDWDYYMSLVLGDTTPPTPPDSLLVAPSLWTSNSTPLLKWSGIVEAQGLDRVEAEWDFSGRWFTIGNGTAGSRQLNAPGLPDGQHVLKVRGVDGRGNIGLARAVAIHIDRQPPAPPAGLRSASHQVNNWSSWSTVEAAWEAAGGDDTAGYSWSWSTAANDSPPPAAATGAMEFPWHNISVLSLGGNWTSDQDAADNWTALYNSNGLLGGTVRARAAPVPDGAYALYLSLYRDINYSGRDYSALRLDGALLDWRNDLAGRDWVFARAVYVTGGAYEFNISGAYAGVGAYLYGIRLAPLAARAESPSLPDGANHTFHIRAADAAGNWGPPSHLGPFRIDATPPAVPGTPAPDGGPVSGTGNITWRWNSSSDNTSGVSGYEVDAGTKPGGKDAAAGRFVGVPSFNMSGGLHGASYYITVRAVDGAGNRGTPVSSPGVAVDLIIPSAPGMPSASYDAASGAVGVFWEASTDEGTGVAWYDVEERNGAGGWLPAGRVNTTSTTFKGRPHGANLTYRVRAADGAGHISGYSAPSEGVVVNAPPAVSLSGPAEGRAGAALAFRAAGTDADGTVSRYEWDYDGDGSTDYSGGGDAVHAYAAAGNYTLRVTVFDENGATASAAIRVAVRGNRPPALAVRNWPGAPLTPENGTVLLRVAGSALDPDGDSLEVGYRVDGGEWREANGSANWSVAAALNLTPGAHRMEVRAGDGNATTVADVYFAVVRPPAMQAPPGGRAVASPGDSLLPALVLVLVLLGTAVGFAAGARFRVRPPPRHRS